MYAIILCDSYREGLAYAQSQKFRRGKYRVASRAGNIRGLRVAEVHQLPSFDGRRDKASIYAALRYARVPAWYVIDEGWQWPLPAADPATPAGKAILDSLIQPFDTSATVAGTGGGSPVDTHVEPVAQGSEILEPGDKTQRVKQPRKPAAAPSGRKPGPQTLAGYEAEQRTLATGIV